MKYKNIADESEDERIRQIGEKTMPEVKTCVDLADKKGGDIAEFPEDLHIREMPEVADGK